MKENFKEKLVLRSALPKDSTGYCGMPKRQWRHGPRRRGGGGDNLGDNFFFQLYVFYILHSISDLIISILIIKPTRYTNLSNLFLE